MAWALLPGRAETRARTAAAFRYGPAAKDARKDEPSVDAADEGYSAKDALLFVACVLLAPVVVVGAGASVSYELVSSASLLSTRARTTRNASFSFRCCDRGASATVPATECILLCPSDAAWLPRSAVFLKPGCPTWPGTSPGAAKASSYALHTGGAPLGSYVCAASGGLWKSGTSNVQQMVHGGIAAMCGARTPRLLSRCNTSKLQTSGILSKFLGLRFSLCILQILL